ncbi:MAG: bifunctional DNA-formamidopyrimidine glycosylase/DNA-(apurinic or apyrimidinic site) lyase [Gammaproteobacteria bacterium]|jgi:formamidopyrimidine-DNA glycosylase
MPELPEVETTRRGIEPHLVGSRIERLIVRQHQLRWPIPRQLPRTVRGAQIIAVRRRAKYLLITTDAGTLIVHLGMSGSLRLLSDNGAMADAHDHVDLIISSGRRLRYTDPRRFGAWLWTPAEPADHALLRHLGPEPLGDDFDGPYLFERSRGRRLAVKSLIMDSRVVAGVGNIYANEALHRAGIHPGRAAGRVGATRYVVLAEAVKTVLMQAIREGGTTLRDFVGGEGKPGYFQQALRVYARTGQPCHACASTVRETRTGQRSSFYCPRCQR